MEEIEGLRIIDDDEDHVVQVERETWDARQRTFPPLNSSSSLIGVPPPVEADTQLLQKVKATAEEAKQKRQQESLYREQAREMLFRDAQKRQEERRRVRLERLARQAEEHSRQRADHQEIELARAEIEQWREAQWDTFREMSDRQQENPVPTQTQTFERAIEDSEKYGENEKSPDKEEEPDSKRAAAKAAKRRRARERKKAQKSAEREMCLKQKESEELDERKKHSANRCAACEGGILGPGFEKFGSQFCSTKCARSGPKDPA